MSVHIAVHVYVKWKSGTSLHSAHALSRVSFRFRSNRAGKPGGRLCLRACGPVRFSAATVRRRKSLKKNSQNRAHNMNLAEPEPGAGCHRSWARARTHQAAAGPRPGPESIWLPPVQLPPVPGPAGQQRHRAWARWTSCTPGSSGPVATFRPGPRALVPGQRPGGKKSQRTVGSRTSSL